MKNLMAFTLLIFISNLSHARFSRGAQFQFVNLEGDLTIQCPAKTSTTVCRENFLEPWPYDVFVGPIISEATSVEFKATIDGDNSIRKAEANYNGRNGRSAEVNLGVSSLFQRPLLRVGKNKIQYNIFDKKKSVLQNGDFTVNVSRSPSRTCTELRVVVGTDNDCDYSYSICQQYFTEMNYCR